MIFTVPAGKLQIRAAGFLVFSMLAIVGTVLGLEHIGGFSPCELCLQQRTPYYIATPLAFLALVSSYRNWPPVLVRGSLFCTGLLMLWGLALGIYQSGIEGDWWEGLTHCGLIDAPPHGDNLLDQLNMAPPPSCSIPAGRYLGLSFAGWNAVASAILALAAFYGALRRQKTG